MPESGRARHVLSIAAVLAGVLSVALGGIGSTVSHAIFDSDAFAQRAAASLGDPRVADLVADRVTTIIIAQSPDLIAIRPLLLVTVRGMVVLEPMRALVRTAARSAHEAFFAEGTRRIALAVPDVGILVQSAFQRLSPDMAERIPAGLHTAVLSIEDGPVSGAIMDVARFRDKLVAVVAVLLGLGVLLIGVGVLIDPNRQRGLVTASMGVLGGGLAILVLVWLGGAVVSGFAGDPLQHGAIQGLWETFMANLWAWGIFLAGLGLITGAAGLSLLQGFRPVDLMRRAAHWVASLEQTRRGRAWTGVAMVILGSVAVWRPLGLVRLAIVAGGLAMALVGMRELFRVAFESAGKAVPALLPARVRRTVMLVPVAVMLVATGGGAWLLHRSPVVVPLASAIASCNGHPVLCGREVSEVVFPGAHNAMSNAAIDDWLFPHHQDDIPSQLRAGVRALLIDVHYGYPGASRIKTDLSAHKTMDVLAEAVGPEGVAAAERIRETLVGVDEGRRGLYLCHGFCELGGYELTPTLGHIRDYLVRHPSEVLIVVIEDYVSPEELAQSFEESGLDDYVYRGPMGPPWPTLGNLVASRSNVLVFLETGTPGVPWLHPAFTSIQETPYTFHTQEEFSCRANRGGTVGTLFQINHWIETTPTPLPSNAEVVNAKDMLLDRAERCRRERGLLPNIIAVDFYGTGDLFQVAGVLNGVATGVSAVQ